MEVRLGKQREIFAGVGGELRVFGFVEVGFVPDIFEDIGQTAVTDGFAVVAIGVERRVEVNQVNQAGIHAAHHVQVVAEEERFVFPVWLYGSFRCLFRGHGLCFFRLLKGKVSARGDVVFLRRR